MNRTAVMTDSNSGITQEEAERLHVFLLPMPIYMDDIMYFENETVTREEFFRQQLEDREIHTSQPVMGDLLDLWEEILKEYEELIYIPMSSGLSGTCASAAAMAMEYEGRVVVADNQRISVTQKQAVMDALKLAEEGKAAEEIRAYLEATKGDSCIYITVDTLKYLKKGGRITPAAAALGAMLNVKPVLTIQGAKLDAFAKVRGIKAAKKRMITAMEEELCGRFADIPEEELVLEAAYTCSEEEALEWKETLEVHFGRSCQMDPLPLSIACHVGPGAIAGAITRKYK